MSHFAFAGLEEFKEELRNLPANLTGEGVHIVQAAANSAEATIKAGYPPGELRDALSSEVTSDGFGVKGLVKNSSKLAVIYENGSEARHYMSKHGVRHETGRMPPSHLFVPTMERVRQRMYDVDFRDLLTRNGLVVTGHA